MPLLTGKVALVAGATRGCGRGIATELGAQGATVYCTGRTTRQQRSPMNRPETIEETAELVTAHGGTGIAVQVDHTDVTQVQALLSRIEAEQHGQLDILVNDVWGGEKMVQWQPFWEQDIDQGLALIRQAVFSHMITARYAAPLLMRQSQAIVFEVTDGDGPYYRGSFFYDFVKNSVIRIAFALAQEFKGHPITALAVTPGYLRSEEMLDFKGLTEANWRDGIAEDAHWEKSETPRLLGRCLARLASDPDIKQRSGQALSSWSLAKEFRIEDADGRRQHWDDEPGGVTVNANAV
jgi:NAD(P)-dependent dehydrogenase (short-subunit alcohol dehydrogenase family)